MDFKENAKKYYQDCLDNLMSLIKINSVYDESSSSKASPFGKGVQDCFTFLKDLAIKDGFKVDECDGYCLEISYGNGPLISVFAHTDVVPATGKWKYDPFTPTLEGEVLYGRGTSDDKGPLMASYYAFKMLKDLSLIKNYRVTLVIGGNEESGSRCLEHYYNVLNKPYPIYGFTPDGDFPLIYGEKGIMNYQFDIDIHLPFLKYIEGGIAFNSVIDKANCLIVLSYLDASFEGEVKQYCLDNHLKYELKDNLLTFFGKSFHGSKPQEGINAGLHLISFLGHHFKNETLINVANYYLDGLGKGINFDYSSPLLKENTFNVGLVSYKDDVLSLTVNFRYGETCPLDNFETRVDPLNLGKITILSNSHYLLFDPNSPFIKTLENVYVSLTGDRETKSMTIGGGTYAKETKNTVAFGSHFPTKIDNIHEPNEKIDLEDLFSSIAIYAKGIYELAKLALGE